MNKSNGNMYEWVTHTWNPLAGKCPHACGYCSTNKLMRYPGIKNKYTGEIRLCEKAMSEKLGNGNFIFVAAQNDLFAAGVRFDIIQQILDKCSQFDNKYLFQTKNPGGIIHFELTEKSVICTTIETNTFYPEHMGCSPRPAIRSQEMGELSKKYDTYVTIEPIMDFDLFEFVEIIKTCNPKQVNIGADSGRNNLPEPPPEKVAQLIAELEKFTTVKQKSNLKRLLK